MSMANKPVNPYVASQIRYSDVYKVIMADIKEMLVSEAFKKESTPERAPADSGEARRRKPKTEDIE